ncbi:MAG: C39 family peptidase [Bacillota bacterium]
MKSSLLSILSLAAILIPVVSADSAQAANDRTGYILLQVEAHGEAWYVFPADGNRYYLGRPDDAFSLMKKLSLGAKHDLIANTEKFPERLSGRILLDVEKNGEAYYIYPGDRQKYYLGRPSDAYKIMRNLGRGIADSGLASIPVGDIDNAGKADLKIIQVVPFTSQAPLGEWSDERQEDGCEEASALMAVSWARGETFTAQEALDSITGASDYIYGKYGEYRDINVHDTLDWIIKDYFHYNNAVVKENVTLSQIIAELEKGRIILAPMNGQTLHNPNYKAPGPPNHMLVIIGYDQDRQVFITNDPGTRKGRSYEYPTDVIYKSIRAYATGYHVPIKEVKKDVIIFSK